MDILLSAVLGELTSRSINFFVSKFSEQSPLDVEDHLCRLLLRAQVIVDEAFGRRVTNQAMLLQMELLRDAMQRGYYRLDTVRSQCHEQETNDDKVVRHSLSFSTVSYLKGLCFSSRNKLVIEQLHGALDDLISVIHDLEEFVVFLTTYPRLYCQPYSMHLELANCMFGRQMEAGLVLDFLLRPQLLGAELDVMPIVGPAHVGKSTLVTHVCNDERVRAHFLEIMFFHIQGFKDGELASFRDECELKHKNCMSESNLDGRSLVVIELIGDLSEDAWCRFYSASKLYVPRGSKIIVTSRFDNIVKFGTTRALTLNYLSHEAYWYFFKTLTFGSMDPKSHPRLTHLAMEIARSQRRCHIGANMIAHLLRDNFNARFWCNVLAFVRGSRSRSGEHPFDLLKQNRPAFLGRMSTSSKDLVVYQRCQRSSEEDVPKIKFQDVLCGNVKPHGKFEVLTWSSVIPPYYSYVDTCEILGLKTRSMKRKRSVKNQVTTC